MTFHIGVISIGGVLLATLLVTFILEISYTGILTYSIWDQYKLNLWQVGISILWILGIILTMEFLLTFYDGARMRHRLRIEFLDRLKDFYYRQLPTMTLVYDRDSTPPTIIQSSPPMLLQLQPQQPQQQMQQPQQVQQPQQLQPQQQQQLPPIETIPVLHIERPITRSTRRRSYY